MKDNKTYTTHKRTQQKSDSLQIKDMFMTICKSDLKVECVKEYKFHPKRKWRFDYAMPEYKIALEVEGGIWTGGRHIRAQGFLGDMEKYNTATLMGWKIFRTTPDDLYKLATINLLRQAINDNYQPEK